MFGRGSRATAEEVQKALTHGKRFSNPSLTLRICPDDKTKVAIIVPKRVGKTAVERHILKRKLAHVIKEVVLPAKTISVFTLNTNIKTNSKEELLIVLASLLDKAK